MALTPSPDYTYLVRLARRQEDDPSFAPLGFHARVGGGDHNFIMFEGWIPYPETLANLLWPSGPTLLPTEEWEEDHDGFFEISPIPFPLG